MVWFCFFFLFAIIVTLRLHPPESLQPLHSLLITTKSPGPWLFSLFTALLRVAVDYYFGARLHFQSTLSPPHPAHIINLQYSYLFPVMLQRLSAIMPQAERTASQSASLCANAVNKNSLGSHSVDSELRWKLAGS